MNKKNIVMVCSLLLGATLFSSATTIGDNDKEKKRGLHMHWQVGEKVPQNYEMQRTEKLQSGCCQGNIEGGESQQQNAL